MTDMLELLRSASVVEMPRIDHSDVYLINEKLSEELVTDLDVLHRDKHRHFMAREAEIQELRKSCGLLRQKSKPRLLPKRSIPKIKISPASDFPDNGNGTQPQGKAETQLGNNDKRKEAMTVSLNRPGFVTDQSKRNDDSDDEDDDDHDDSNSHTSDDEGSNEKDRYFDSDTDSDDIKHSNDPFRASRLRRRPVPQKISMGTLQRKGTPIITKKTKLEILMDRLKLEKYPSHWYNSVVPASDVQLIRGDRAISSVSSSKLRQRQNRPQTCIGIGALEENPIFQTRETITRGSQRSTKTVQNNSTPKSAGLPGRGKVKSALNHRPATSKTRRQLLEIEASSQKEDREDAPKRALQRRYLASKEEQLMLDEKVKKFLQSLDELEKPKTSEDLLETFGKRSRRNSFIPIII